MMPNFSFNFLILSSDSHFQATNSEMALKYSQFVAAGPTFDQQPPFQWSKTEWKKPVGHPDIFKFEPQLLDWKMDNWDINPSVKLE